MRFLIILTLCSFAVMASDNAKNFKIPSHILALDEETDKVLRTGAFADDVVKDDAHQREFQQKVRKASLKISPIVSMNENEKVAFIYDCLFLLEDGLMTKYSNLSKDKLSQARLSVIESFE